MQYEVLRENAAGLQMPESYFERLWQAEQYAIDLAHDGADGGYTGRAIVCNEYDEVEISVRARKPLTLIHNYRIGDLPLAMWNGREFDYYKARYSKYPNRAFLSGAKPCKQ
jgi:hypothetical protein